VRLPALRPFDPGRVYRRLEARGEIRGGRFVAGFSGEQYALPEAVGLLRETRRQPVSDQWVSLSGADPLNLAGILTPGPRLAALTGNRLIYRDGVPIAVLSGGNRHARNCRAMGGTEQAVAFSRAGIDGRATTSQPRCPRREQRMMLSLAIVLQCATFRPRSQLR
jgi:hypothetical protein